MQQFSRKRLKRLVTAPLIVLVVMLLYSFSTTVKFPFSAILREKAGNSTIAAVTTAVNYDPAITFFDSKKTVYDSLDLGSLGLSRKVYNMALKGMEKLKRAARIHNNILSIIDFTQPSTSKRLFIIDLDNSSLLFNTLVAHGNKSGKEWARSFSNKPRSNKSSIGFYVTGEPYNGSNGYSLKLQGVEAGFNNNAMKRAIVLHGANYVNEEYISSQGYIGRSQGCPAVMSDLSTPIIESIKEGSCLFIYYPLPLYLKKSSLLK